MASEDPVTRLTNASESLNTTNARKAVFLLFIAPIASFVYGIVDLIDVGFDLFIVPAQSFIRGIGQLILAVVGGAADIVNAGSGAAARSFLTGIWSALGPAAFPAAIITIGAAALVLARVNQETETSDSLLGLFSGIDWPDLPGIPIGQTEEDEEGNE